MTLVFLHEGLGCVEMWKGFPAALVAAAGLRGLAYDRRGHGRSEGLRRARGADYLHRLAFEELPAVLDACSVATPVLVGHSDGATIALLYAARHPTAAVVAEAAHAFVEEAALAGIRATLTRYTEGDLRCRLSRYHGGKTDALVHAWADTWLAPWFRGWDVTEELREVTCPVLLLQGADDGYATPAHLDAIARSLGGPVTSRLLEGCGHAPHRDLPRRTLDLVTRFLDGVVEAGSPGTA
jgi:pimeloyl-ACP methyl ester carboxylesterase